MVPYLAIDEDRSLHRIHLVVRFVPRDVLKTCIVTKQLPSLSIESVSTKTSGAMALNGFSGDICGID
jgi:hypothetical protein